MTTPAFRDAYERLNAEQRKAVDTVYGPVMVVAGPGTGKTELLAVRIGNIIEKAGAKPDEILALTFTESAVAALRARLAKLMGSTAYRVPVHTFHSFAKEILSTRPDLFPRIAEGTQLSDVAGVALMEEILDAGGYQRIRSPKTPYRAARSLLSFISQLKRERFASDRYRDELARSLDELLRDPARFNEKGKYAGAEKGEFARRRERLEKHLEVADAYARYEEALRERNLYDYEDLLIEAAEGLSREDTLRDDIRERRQFILADEHQDANPAQNRILELVAGPAEDVPNVFVVGDEKQAIYRFQGASTDTFLAFRETYPDATVISLVENYRSTAEVLDAAHELILPISPESSSLRSARGAGPRLLKAVAETPADELATVAAYLLERHAEGISYDEMAVIVRTNADVLSVAFALSEYGIPEDHATADLSALAHPVGALFLALIRAAANPRDDAAYARALLAPGLPGTLPERTALLSRRTGTVREALLGAGGSFASLAAAVDQQAERAAATPIVEWLASLARDTGFLTGVLSLSEDAYEAYRGVSEEAKQLSEEDPAATVFSFLARIDRILLHDLPVARARAGKSGVKVLTAHKSKGLEFSRVIVARALDDRYLKGRRAEFSLLLEDPEDETDARRLFYVALTRARDELLVTLPKVSAEGRAVSPLRFLSDIEGRFDGYSASLPRHDPSVRPRGGLLDPEFLTERLLARGFSPTSLNNFLEDPWAYYFRNLLRVPDAETPALLFGTAVHAGLKAFADTSDASAATAALRVALLRAPLSEQDRDELLARGSETLAAYLATESFAAVRETERAVIGSVSVPGIGEVPLTGKLDRLDVREDGTVVVVDYKTGKAKSENDILGKTATSDGSYYRQLVFYKLLLAGEGKYRMDAGALHFVEPDDKGRTVVREFRIGDDEMDALRETIADAAARIANGSAFAEPSPESRYRELALAVLTGR